MSGGYPLARLYEEIAFIAYYFHWSYSDLLEMEHGERRRWCVEISSIHERMGHTKESGRSLESVAGRWGEGSVR